MKRSAYCQQSSSAAQNLPTYLDSPNVTLRDIRGLRFFAFWKVFVRSEVFWSRHCKPRAVPAKTATADPSTA